MKRSSAIFLIAVLVVSTSALVYFSMPDIHYYSYSILTEYQKNGDHWYTIYVEDNSSLNGTFTTISCQNKGLFASSFSIIITLENAYFSSNQGESNGETNGTVAEIPYILQPMEENITAIPFVINSTHFTISISVKTSQTFIRYSEDNWAGQSVFQYGGYNNTLRCVALA